MRLDDGALKRLFLDARTHRAWLPREVPDGVLQEIVNLAKMGPTANNGLPPSRVPSAVIAVSFSSLIAIGRPPVRPRFFAAANPATIRSFAKARSNWAKDPNMLNKNSPWGVVVSICSVSERNATFLFCRSVTMLNK